MFSQRAYELGFAMCGNRQSSRYVCWIVYDGKEPLVLHFIESLKVLKVLNNIK